MFKLGIIGSDNSHALQFARLANHEEGVNGFRMPDVAVTHIYGTDQEKTKEVAEKGKIETIVSSPEEMVGRVDGVACVWRHGSKHCEYVMPFLNAGVPVFVDKPLATTIVEAKRMIDTAQKARVGFTSFSTLRYATSTVTFVKSLNEKVGEICSGVSTGPADRHSEYDGIFFYGIHAVELMNTVFGCGCSLVTAKEEGKNVVTICHFPNDVLVTLHLLGNAAYTFHIVAYGTKGWDTQAIDSSTCYYEGMKTFVECMRTGVWPLTPEQLLKPVAVLQAIEKSLNTGSTCEVSY